MRTPVLLKKPYRSRNDQQSDVQTGSSFSAAGYSKSAIVKALEFDSRTVAKYFAMEEEDYRAYRQDHLFRGKAFDDLRSKIFEVYDANDFRTLQVSSVYDYLEEKYGVLPGNEQTLRNYIAYKSFDTRIHILFTSSTRGISHNVPPDLCSQ